MRIVVHDFSGHPFQVQLSRELAIRCHDVLHLYFAGFESPKGRLGRAKGDPQNLEIRGLDIGRPYNKYAPVQRLLNDRRYASRFSSVVRDFNADIVLSANATPSTQNWLRTNCQRAGVPFVAWIQDLYGKGVRTALKSKLGVVGDWAGRIFRHVDRSLIERSDGVVFISQEFCEEFKGSQGHSRGRWHVIENWAPLEELPVGSKTNAWSRQHQLADKRVILYSGTLGLKHNPELLVALANHYRDVPDVVVVVISQGLGRSHLERRKQELGLTSLRLFDYQPFDVLPDVMASADVLVSIIEREAGSFSVPSKVLTYLCAGRPLLLAVPRDNLAAKIVKRSEAGLVVEPDDTGGFLRAAAELLESPDYAAGFAQRAREYASTTFQIGRITDEFEAVFRDAFDAPCRRNHVGTRSASAKRQPESNMG